jgi:7-carboxy-7-deazaguanine synthase (Cx14CxxC type)
MSYIVKEIFLTSQGEGANIGRTAVFIRFAGCNLWSGREEDREKAICRFCDTDFVGGTRFASPDDLANAAAALWPVASGHMAVLTGGEPLLQVDDLLIAALRVRGFFLAVETNGTRPIPKSLDWVCVSPKAGAPLVVTAADELKLVYRQAGAEPERYRDFVSRYRWLSPMDGPLIRENTQLAAAYCRANPDWRLAIQAHKTWGIP